MDRRIKNMERRITKTVIFGMKGNGKMASAMAKESLITKTVS
jgi:hypothetical protein